MSNDVIGGKFCTHGVYDYHDALARGEDVYPPHTWAEYDARGIYLCKVCEHCADAKLSTYRKEVLTNSDYWADEDIDGDDW